MIVRCKCCDEMGFLSFAHSEFNNFCFYYGSIAIYLIFEPKCKLLLLLLIFVVVVVVGVFFFSVHSLHCFCFCFARDVWSCIDLFALIVNFRWCCCCYCCWSKRVRDLLMLIARIFRFYFFESFAHARTFIREKKEKIICRAKTANEM